MAIPWLSRFRAWWNSYRATASIVGVALLGGIVDDDWERKAYAGTPLVHDVLITPLYDGFETGTTFVGGECNDCDAFFARVTTDALTGSYSYYAPDSGRASDLTAFSAPVAIPPNATSAELRFWHRFDFENNDEVYFDGSVVEISTDVRVTWTDLGSHILAGGYTGTIAERGDGNPLETRAAWVGTSSDWQQVTVDLTSYSGQRIDLRFRVGTDGSNFEPFGGWWVDELQVIYQAPLTSCARGWTVLAPYPQVVGRVAIAGVGSDLYAFGGSEIGNNPTAVAYRYSTERDSWDPIAPLPEPRLGASAVSDGQYIYILGGIASTDAAPTTTLWRYDPVANNYVTVASFGSSTAYQAAVYLNGSIYKIAGQRPDQAFTSNVEVYSIADDMWSAAARYPVEAQDVAAVVIDGRIFTAGGRSSAGFFSETYRYDPSRNVWDTGPIADLPPQGGTTIGAFYNGTLIALSDGLTLGWDFRTNNWRSLDQIPTTVLFSSVSVIDDAVYILGGVPNARQIALQQYVESNCGCLGDCGGDGTVSVSELVRGVGIALRTQPLSGCMAFDGDGDGNVAVNELVKAVGNALNGCSG